MKKNLFILFSILTVMIMGACTSSTPDIDTTLPVLKPAEAPVIIEADYPLLQTPATSTLALNPPHGEPGHDCNIAVGSPLNGSANSMSAPLPVMPSAVNPVNNPTSNRVRLNPPHGEPGHDCNIQVGQPLS